MEFKNKWKFNNSDIYIYIILILLYLYIIFKSSLYIKSEIIKWSLIEKFIVNSILNNVFRKHATLTIDPRHIQSSS